MLLVGVAFWIAHNNAFVLAYLYCMNFLLLGLLGEIVIGNCLILVGE